MRATGLARIGCAALLLLGVLMMRGEARGGGPQTPDDVAAACQIEMFALRDGATAALLTEIVAFRDALDALPPEASGVDAARLGAATSARVEKIGVKAIAAINKSADRCIVRLQRIGADSSYTNGTDAQRISIVTILSDSLRFSAQAAIAGDMVDFMDQ